MSKEVSGQPEGVTLLECINEGAVPFPERMSFVRWLEWRRQTGSRPVKRRDGRSTSSADEVALWRAVMDFLHDVKEEDEEEEEEEEEDDEDESPPPEEPVDDLDGPELIPDAGEGPGEAAGLGAPTGPSVAAGLGALTKEPAPAVPKDADGLGRGDSPLRARLAAMEMELEALKRGSDGGASVADGGQAADLAAALKEQTETLKEALSARGGQSSITTVKTDLVWPTLTDDKSDTKDVVLFYEEFEDVCALANNCRGMSAREKLLALRARCKGSRAKTYTNAYRAAWKTGEVTEDPEAVYLRIKNKHLMFGESREEREVRIDGEHQALVKGRLSGHQFEPLFEASVADLESVGLGKTPRELYLSYLRKMPPHLQKEIRQDKRIWPGDAKDVGLRSPATWDESHKVVLEYEQREAAHRAVAHSTYSTTAGEVPDPSAALAKAQKEIRELKAAARPSGAAAKDSTLAAGSGAKGSGKGAASKICFHFRDHENCPKGDSCPFSHDKELRKQALAAKRGESTLAAKGGKGGGKGGGKAGAAKAKPKAKPKAAPKSAPKPPGTVCPFFQKTGSCRKGANCDMVHSLLAGQGQALPAGPFSGASMSNPFAAFSIQIGSAGVQAGLPAADPKGAVREHALALKKGESGDEQATGGRWQKMSPVTTSTGPWSRYWGAASSVCSTGAPGPTT